MRRSSSAASFLEGLWPLRPRKFEAITVWRSVLSGGPGPSPLEGGAGEGFECEHACRDPKDGELCLSGAKPEETLVEARSDTDVQIVRLTWV
ncbi:unnamed protein product [Malus fusca]